MCCRYLLNASSLCRVFFFFFSSRRRHTRCLSDWSSDVCSSDLVVSAEIRNSLVSRGIDPAKILVNPNGVDLDAYAPGTPETREPLRASLGFGQIGRASCRESV